MKRRFVNVYDSGNMTMFCTGIYDDFEKALGATMWDIFDFQESYKDEGDFFEIGGLEELDGDGGLYITVTFKASSWKESDSHNYYILFQDDEEEEDERNKTD